LAHLLTKLVKNTFNTLAQSVEQRTEKLKTISGFGVGLYLVSAVLRHHQSRIQVESTLGSGSTFYFILPLVKADPE
jgi:signal transduction histidine kinase